MRSAHVLAVRAALLGLVLVGIGCFRPNISTGGFSCGDGGVHGGICPDGLTCNGKNVCVSSLKDGGVGGSSGGTGGAAGKGGQGGMDGGPRDMGPPDRPCLDPIASCQQGGTGMCDPVCNMGCGDCYRKCSVDTNGDLTCNALNPPDKPAVGLLKFCSQFSPLGSPALQTDNCAPGQICLNASACGVPRCYQFCRHDTDCAGNASCSRDGGAYQFCDVPPKVCDPLPGGTGASDCAGLGGSCYLAPSGKNTLCDCQFNGAGTGHPGDACTYSRDCLAGNVCVLISPSLGNKCEPVCLLPVDGGTDNCASGCQVLSPGSTSIYGFCNI